MIDPELINRIRQDITRIHEAGDRTGPVADRPLRWEGVPANPNGWRRMRDLADDLQLIVEYLDRNIDDLR